MTAAFNLSQLANNLNSSGQLDATDGLSGAVPVANGGTGLTSVGTSGNVLTSNGSAWVSQSIAAGGNYVTQTFISPGTWTKPAGLKAVKVTVIGGGGGGASANATAGTGGTSSFGSFASATGGLGGLASQPTGAGNPGPGGSGSSGDLNINGTPGIAFDNRAAIGGPTFLGSGGAVSLGDSTLRVRTTIAPTFGGGGGACQAAPNTAASGGGGGTSIRTIAAPNIPGPVSITVGVGGAGTSAPAPLAALRQVGAAGVVIVEEFY